MDTEELVKELRDLSIEDELPPMNDEFKVKWIDALLSGDYLQGTGCLRSTKNEYCCLGVLCDIADVNKWKQGTEKEPYWYHDGVDPNFPSYAIGELTGLDPQVQAMFAEMNDNGATFEFMADVIQRKL